MAYQWDPEKAEINFRKHGVSFEEASTVFDDALAGSFHDLDHSDEEDRFLTVGRSASDRIVIVSHTYRGDNVRIISARPAAPKEVRAYEENGQS
jgi:hypothetical protein